MGQRRLDPNPGKVGKVAVGSTVTVRGRCSGEFTRPRYSLAAAVIIPAQAGTTQFQLWLPVL